jgi:hypothetical protein
MIEQAYHFDFDKRFAAVSVQKLDFFMIDSDDSEEQMARQTQGHRRFGVCNFFYRGKNRYNLVEHRNKLLLIIIVNIILTDCIYDICFFNLSFG